MSVQNRYIGAIVFVCTKGQCLICSYIFMSYGLGGSDNVCGFPLIVYHCDIVSFDVSSSIFVQNFYGKKQSEQITFSFLQMAHVIWRQYLCEYFRSARTERRRDTSVVTGALDVAQTITLPLHA